MELILNGDLCLIQAPAAIQSWSRYFIHQGALAVAVLDTLDERRAALAAIPQTIRPYVEMELKRIWPMLRQAPTP